MVHHAGLCQPHEIRALAQGRGTHEKSGATDPMDPPYGSASRSYSRSAAAKGFWSRVVDL